MPPTVQLLLGDCREKLRELPDDSVDSVVCDPPYGLSKEPDIAEVMQHWINGDHYEHGSSGFMGKTWDSFVPGPEYWREVWRVLKPGGHVIAFAGTRTWDLMSMALRFAGFENRDTVASFGGPPAIAWTYGSGFPKSLDVSKAIDKAAGVAREVIGEKPDRWTNKGSVLNFATDRAQASVSITGEPATPQAAAWQGWGTALKPAWEVALVFRKPLSESTVAKNILKHGTGAINIDGCRVGKANAADESESKEKNRHADFGSGARENAVYGADKRERGGNGNYNPPGRWPANVMLSHSNDCRLVGTKKVQSQNPAYATDGIGQVGFSGGGSGRVARAGIGHADADGTETVESWDCVDDCAVRLVDEQSHERGIHGAGRARSGPAKVRESDLTPTSYAPRKTTEGMHRFGDIGGASRFFYTAKASRRERNAGCEDLPETDALVGANIVKSCRNCGAKITVHPGGGLTCPCGKTDAVLAKVAQKARANNHATVKPVKLMEYLVRLVTPPGGTVLDPFMGSGTTGVAAVHEGFNFIGIEREADYMAICEARIAHAQKDKDGEQPELPLAA